MLGPTSSLHTRLDSENGRLMPIGFQVAPDEFDPEHVSVTFISHLFVLFRFILILIYSSYDV